MSSRVRQPLVVALALAAGLATASAAGADAIGGADYKGKVRGDGDNIKFTTSSDGRQIGSIAVQFDARCHQGSDEYTNKNTSVVFYRVKVRPSGKFKKRDVRNYQGGHEKAVVRGRFSADGTTAKGKFTFEGTAQFPGIPRYGCSAKGRFKAKTKARPPGGGGGSGDPSQGDWEGTTDEGLPVEFDVTARGLQELAFIARVDCTYDNGETYSEERAVVLPRAELNGDSFAATRGPDHIRGTFDRQTATGVVSVASHYDDFQGATCVGRGEIPFTARPVG